MIEFSYIVREVGSLLYRQGCPWLVGQGWSLVEWLAGWLGGLSMLGLLLLGVFFFKILYVVVWHVQGAPPPLIVGASSLVLFAFYHWLCWPLGLK